MQLQSFLIMYVNVNQYLIYYDFNLSVLQRLGKYILLSLIFKNLTQTFKRWEEPLFLIYEHFLYTKWDQRALKKIFPTTNRNNFLMTLLALYSNMYNWKKAKSVSGQTSKFTRKPCVVQEV